MAAEKPNLKTRDDDARGTPAGAGTVLPEHGGRIGNPPFVPTERQRGAVEAYVKQGLTAEDVGKMLGISERTVRRHFAAELEISRIKVKAAIGASLIKKALAGNLTAQIFYLRTQAKWNTRVEHTGPDGGPIRTFDLSQFDYDQKRLLVGIIDQLLEQGGEGDGPDADSPLIN
jgi:predicted ArsR family transcriptional regulator